MAVTLDSDERARVEAARLPVRPRFYNAAVLQEQTISTDFEAFLILQDAATISATVAWLGTAGLLDRTELDRNAVAFEALIEEQADTADQLDEVTDATTQFTEFRDAFQAGKFSEATEVGLIIRDLQESADELFATEARLRHLQHAQTRVQNVLRQSISSARLQELQSWPTPLLTY